MRPRATEVQVGCRQVPRCAELQGRWKQEGGVPRGSVSGWARDMSSRLLFIAEEQGRGISPAARGPPGHSLPSPAPTTHHLLRRPQQPLTSSQPHRSPLATRAGGCEIQGRGRVGLDEEDGVRCLASTDR